MSIKCPFISRKRYLSNIEIFRRDSLSFNKTVYQLNTIFSLPPSSQTHRETKTNTNTRERRANRHVCGSVMERGRMAVKGGEFGGAVPRTGNALCP